MSKDLNLEFNKNEDFNKQSVFQLKTKHKKVCLGGGEKAAAKQKEKNKLLARERIDYLIDKDTPFVEIGAFAGDGMYEEYGGCPSGGVVCGIGYVSGKQCMIVANDATVKAGAWFPITGKKNLQSTRNSHGKPFAYNLFGR
jgi:3-methylcrotonyl-CoA carboxylase beta subunit